MRRGPGLAALERSSQSAQQYTSLSSELSTQQLQDLKNQLETFGSSLRSFASSHRNDIKRDPAFRHAFQKMCASIGIDPLSGPNARGTSGNGGIGGKINGIWSDLLGLGDWQYELGIQIIDVCVSTKHLNGGLIRVEDLIRGVLRLRTGKDPFSIKGKEVEKNLDYSIDEEDIIRSLKVLKPLGSGYQILEIGSQKWIRSIPKEFNEDESLVLNLLSNSRFSMMDEIGLPFLTVDGLIPARRDLNLKESKDADREALLVKTTWTAERSKTVLEDMVNGDDSGTGLLWIDEGTSPARYYSLAVCEAILEKQLAMG